MRNYLKFEDNLINNNINSLYLDFKKNFTNQKKTFNNYKKNLLNEEENFIILSNKINSDFNNFNNSTLDKNKLT